MPLDPARLKTVGHLVLTDAQELRTLANPVRLALFDLARRDAPITSPTLARTTDQDQTSVELIFASSSHSD